MKAMLRTVTHGEITYQALAFICPGCKTGGPPETTGLHLLPVNAEGIKEPQWSWDGDLERPTLNPSILTHGSEPKDGVPGPYPRCHSYLRAGVFEFLSDSTHPLAGQFVEMPDLPDWFVEDSTKEEDNG